MDGKVVIGCELDTKSFDAQIKKLEFDLDDLIETYKELEKSKPFEGKERELRKLKSEIQNTSNKLIDLRNKQRDVEKSKFADNMNKGITKTIKNVGKWAIALFGIQTVYSGIRSAMSTLTQYDDQMSSNIEYIKYALANVLKPIIQWILNAITKVLQYINAIVKAWTGNDLFSSADAFDTARKNAKGLNKELKKTTASFDEINTVSSQKSSTGGADTISPNIDLTAGFSEEKTEKIKNFWGDIIKFWEEDWQESFTVEGNWNSFFAGLGMTLEGFYQIFKGLWDTLAGIIDIFIGIFTGDTEKMQEGWDKLCQGLLNILKGVLNLIVGLLLVVLGFIKGLLLDLWDGIKSLCSTIGTWIYDHVIKPVADFFVGLWNGIVNGVTWAVNGIKNIFSTVVNFFKNIINTIFGFFKKIGTAVGNVIGSAFKAVINGILKAIESILNFPIKAINKLIGVINKVPGINLGTLSTFNLPRLAKGGIINQPGRGIPVGYGQAIAGERGQEGVLPLTDSQQMALLGEAIGKYVRIDNVIDVNMDSRRINRILQSSNNRVAFAGNR